MVLPDKVMLCIRWHMGAFDDKERWNNYGRACTAYIEMAKQRIATERI